MHAHPAPHQRPDPPPGPRLRIGVDTGGTFSDFVVLDETTGAVRVFKESSTPAAPERAILTGLDRALAGGDGAAVGFFCHGTTVATNAVLTGRTARAGLVITEGFRGIHEVQEQARPYGPPTFDLFWRRPPLLVPPRLTVEVRERVGADGAVVTPFDEASAVAALEGLAAAGVEAVAVCFLFSFLRPDHERRVRDLAARILPGVPVSLSSEVAPFIREYPRLATTVLNAALQPVVSEYLGRLDGALSARGLPGARRYVMLSHGGMTPVASAGAQAVGTVLSGLAGGVTAAAAIAQDAGVADAIAFDMGGTSCDVAVITGGEPERRSRSEIEGRPIALPTLGIDTLSAGGGTLARVDAAGLLQVGPDSAGASPGPACYGRGGTEPTVTDANVVLGYLGGEAALAGSLRLDGEAARRAVAQRLAEPLGLSVEAAAMGVLRLIDVKMAEAVRAIATGRGLDLRDFTLIAFGGAGPLHATRVAEALGLPRVLVPAWPGVTSALGLLEADVRIERVRTAPAMLDAMTGAALGGMLGGLAEAVRAGLAADGFAASEIDAVPAVDLRYEGQGYELSVPVPEPAGAAVDMAALRARFDALHRTRFGHGAEDARVEFMAARVAGVGRVVRVPRARPEPAAGPSAATVQGVRRMAFAAAGGIEWHETPVYDRGGLAPGHRFAGPALVTQDDSTTLVLPGQRVSVDACGNLVIVTVAGQGAAP